MDSQIGHYRRKARDARAEAEACPFRSAARDQFLKIAIAYEQLATELEAADPEAQASGRHSLRLVK